MGSPFMSAAADVYAPISEAALARIISAKSGFFFWGMIELVEQKASLSEMNPAKGELQMISSSQSRLIPTIIIERLESVSRAKSRDETASMVFSSTPSKPSSCATYPLFTGYPVDAKAAAPRGDWLTRE